jgi:hypothetical protein
LSSSIASEICPDFTAASTLSASSQPPLLPASWLRGEAIITFICGPPGISRSMPALTVGTVE